MKFPSGICRTGIDGYDWDGGSEGVDVRCREIQGMG